MSNACGSDSTTLLKHMQNAVNDSKEEFRPFPQHADSVLQGRFPRSLKRLQQVQQMLLCLPPRITGDLKVLMLVMVQNRLDNKNDLRGMMSSVPADFSVYHYDCRTLSDAACLAYSSHAWFSSRVVHRGIRGEGTGCILEALKGTIEWMVYGAGKNTYTHLWKVDSDLGFELFNWRAFEALVKHKAPFLCQPAILPQNWRRRATDRWSLRSALGPYIVGPQNAQPTLEVSGRARLLGKSPPRDDVEIMCPFIDARILPVVAAAIEPMDTRNDVLASESLNTIAQRFGQVSGRWPAGYVFDYVPLLHRDTRLIGWGRKTRSLNTSRCPRKRLDPNRFGRGALQGEWEELFSNLTFRDVDLHSWLPVRQPTFASA